MLFDNNVHDIDVRKPHGGFAKHHVQELIGTYYCQCVDCHKWFHDRLLYLNLKNEYRRSRWLYAMIAVLCNKIYSKIINFDDWLDNLRYGCNDNG
jgi:hypothetical protein